MLTFYVGAGESVLTHPVESILLNRSGRSQATCICIPVSFELEDGLPSAGSEIG